MNQQLKEKLQSLPELPGVYLMKDDADRILYVGKSGSLRQRVRSYFQSSGDLSPKIRWLVSKIHDLETIVVNSELESLILECNLIKRHRPYFNMKYRDDKRYPMLEISTGEVYPKIRVVRRPVNHRHRYFGPFPDAGALRRTIKILKKVFQIRTCRQDMKKVLERPCLDYYIGLCSAPCSRFASPEEYRRQVDQAIDFLEGRTEHLLTKLKAEMAEEAEKLNFERCARLRDMLADLERTLAQQDVVTNREEDEDFVSLIADPSSDLACAQVLQVREGKLQGHRSFVLQEPASSSLESSLASFIQQYYLEQTFFPNSICCGGTPSDRSLLEEWLTQKAGRKVVIRDSVRGHRRKMLQLAEKNANQTLQLELSRPGRSSDARRKALDLLAEALQLDKPPWRMECVDISNFQGRQAVGSLVVFEQGLPRVDLYRRFRIRSGDTPDDFRMMREVLTRRFAREQTLANRSDLEAGDAGEKESRQGWGLPDLLIVDGGKGQLGVAVEVLAEFGLSSKVAVAGLAKENEWLFLPGRTDPVIIDRRSAALLCVTHMRDETHRFAITYHRNVRKKAFKKSLLDDAPGIGAGRKQTLLKAFGSLKKLSDASPQELGKVGGLGPKLAQSLYDFLRKNAPLPKNELS